jgi:hypothetical protein
MWHARRAASARLKQPRAGWERAASCSEAVLASAKAGILSELNLPAQAAPAKAPTSTCSTPGKQAAHSSVRWQSMMRSRKYTVVCVAAGTD